MAINQREHLLIALALTVIGLLVADRFILTPSIHAWETRSERIKTLQNDLNNGRTLVNHRASLEARWKEMRERSLPANHANAENQILTALNDWADSSRLTVTNTRPDWSEDPDLGELYRVTILADGGLSEVARFLYELERSPLTVRLEQVTIRTQNDNGDSLTLNTVFTGLVLPEAK